MIGANTISRADLRERIDALPRVQLAHRPTPLEACPRLSETLGGPRILIKRDDCTGLAFGGNKARQLEFTLGQAVAEGADIIVHGAAAQSNHCRQAAAAAAKLGLPITLVLPRDAKSAPVQGNLLLDHLLGAEIRMVDPPGPGTGMDEIKQQVAEEYRRKGLHPFVIAPPISAVLGAIAYVECMLEICDQLEDQGLTASHVVTCSSAATQPGLLLTSKATGADLHVIGISPSYPSVDRATAMADTANRAAELLGLDLTMSPEEFQNSLDYVGEGYGIMTEASTEALRLLARTEGILLDPSYTAKAFAGLIDMIRNGRIAPEATVVLVHTGGTPALFAYAEELAEG